jgi:hypothetical protein
MSSKEPSSRGDHEYLRAAVREKEHIQDEYGVVVDTVISMRSSPYVVVVRSEAREKGGKSSLNPLASCEGSWPNVQVVSWTAFVFQHYCKLSKLIEDCRRAEDAFWEEAK